VFFSLAVSGEDNIKIASEKTTEVVARESILFNVLVCCVVSVGSQSSWLQNGDVLCLLRGTN
jgi:hypothetical protein